jgi:hypothetical protein
LKINKLYFTNNILTITTCFGSCHHQVIFAQLSGMEGVGVYKNGFAVAYGMDRLGFKSQQG